MTGTFLDTIVVCSITGIVLTMAGLYSGDVSGATLTINSFDAFLPGMGKYIVSIGLIFFAYSTVLGWSYYGEKCFQYIFNRKAVVYYRYAFVIFAFIGCTLKLTLVWDIADTLNGAMAIPNLIGLVGLSGVIAAETKEFIAIRKREIETERSISC